MTSLPHKKGGAFDSAKNHKRQRRKRQSVTAKREKSQTRVAVISAKSHKRQRRKRQSVSAKREKSQTPKVLTAILTLPNLT